MSMSESESSPHLLLWSLVKLLHWSTGSLRQKQPQSTGSPGQPNKLAAGYGCTQKLQLSTATTPLNASAEATNLVKKTGMYKTEEQDNFGKRHTNMLCKLTFFWLTTRLFQVLAKWIFTYQILKWKINSSKQTYFLRAQMKVELVLIFFVVQYHFLSKWMMFSISMNLASFDNVLWSNKEIQHCGLSFLFASINRGFSVLVWHRSCPCLNHLC